MIILKGRPERTNSEFVPVYNLKFGIESDPDFFSIFFFFKVDQKKWEGVELFSRGWMEMGGGSYFG